MKLFLLVAFCFGLFAADFIKSNVYIEASFPDGDKREGMGVIIDKNGNILTNAKVVYSGAFDLEANDITIKIQDVKDQPAICFAKSKIKAIDTDKSLAILKLYRNSDIFCNTIISKSRYHAGYYQKYSEDIFGLNSSSSSTLYPKEGSLIYYPIYSDSFTIQKSSVKSSLQEFAKTPSGRIVKSIQLEKQIPESSIGAGGYGEKGDFLGIMDTIDDGENQESLLITKNIVTGWFCELANKEILELLVANSEKSFDLRSTTLCKNLGYEYSHGSKNWNY